MIALIINGGSIIKMKIMASRRRQTFAAFFFFLTFFTFSPVVSAGKFLVHRLSKKLVVLGGTKLNEVPKVQAAHRFFSAKLRTAPRLVYIGMHNMCMASQDDGADISREERAETGRRGVGGGGGTVFDSSVPVEPPAGIITIFSAVRVVA